MKKKILPLCLAMLVLYCLLFPQQMAQSVSDGLALWYRSILPTLLPFCIFSNIIVQSGVYDRIFERLFPVVRHIYPVRAPLIYPLAAGFLFGFPLGSKICADLYDAGKISSKEAETVCCISNNFGPAFLYNYMIAGVFDRKIPAIVLLAACYLPPLLLGRIQLSWLRNHRQAMIQAECPVRQNIKTASRSQINMRIIDAGIMNGFTTMIKLAGYILLASLLASILKILPWNNSLIPCICVGAMEITNGLHQIAVMQADLPLSAALAVGMVNFGGISGLMQTSGMMKSTGIHIQNYIVFKLLCSLSGILMLAALFPFL